MKFYITVPSVALEFDKRLLRKILGQAGREIANTARSLIGRAAGGRRYGSHIASAPGQPPESLTGALARSLKVKASGDRVGIKDVAFYAKFLEVGAKGGGGKKGSRNKRGKPQTPRILLARPFLSVAADEEMPSLQQRIQQALSKSIDLKILKAQTK